MTKTKLEKIAGIEEQILQLDNQRKLLLQKQKEDDRKSVYSILRQEQREQQPRRVQMDR